MPSRAGAASADAVAMRSQPIIPPCFTSCFRDPRYRPLLVAIQHGHVEAVKMLIANGASTGGVNNEESFYDVPSPLITAIRSGRSDIVAILLEGGASVDEREINGNLEYPLHAAVRSEDYEIFHMVLNKGPKVDCVDLM